MIYKNNWEETKERFTAWWEGKRMDRPLLKVISRKKGVHEAKEAKLTFKNPEEKHIGVEKKIKKARDCFSRHYFHAESYPNLSLNIGPGSMAVYLGSQPIFKWDTVWFEE